MAAFNAGEFIADSIKSVLNQTFDDFELIIVNDGSTDCTQQIVEQFSDPRIRLFSNTKNMGLVYTRNRSKDLARGRFIAILDSDDIAHQHRLELQYKFLLANPETVLCGGHARQIDGNGAPTGTIIQVPTKPNLAATMLFGNPFVNSSTMFSKEVFLSFGGYRDFAPAEDYDLFVRIAEKYTVTNLDSMLVDYRVHSRNISLIQSERLIVQEKKIITHMLSSLGISVTEHAVQIYYEIFSRKLDEKHINKYYTLLLSIIDNNKLTKKYKDEDLAYVIYSLWYEILMDDKIKTNALFMLLRPAILHWEAFTFKQLRRVFKKSLKSIFK